MNMWQTLSRTFRTAIQKKSGHSRHRDYQGYLNHQKEKSLDPERRKKWLTEEWQVKLQGFRDIFNSHAEVLQECSNALCIGARTGQEVQALRDLGVDAVGIDLVEAPPLVLEGDMHELSFPSESFDFVFSNSFDHSLYPEKCISEIERVLRQGGWALMHLQIGIAQDEYTETVVTKSSEIVGLYQCSDVIIDRSIPQNFAAMNYELLFRKVLKNEF